MSEEYATNEQEQTAVWVKLVDVSPEIKQGYRPIGVFMNEPPPIPFGYAFFVTGKFLLASVLWGLIVGFVWGILYLVFHILSV